MDVGRFAAIFMRIKLKHKGCFKKTHGFTVNKNDPAFKAYSSFNAQLRRCYNPRNKQYKYYGGKGVEVKYSLPQFVKWWRRNIKQFKGTIPTVGRIDHNGHYEFANINMEDKSVNSRERALRAGGFYPIKRISIIDFKTMKEIAVAETTVDASRLTGVMQNKIGYYCKGVLKKSRGGYTFRYKDET